MAVLSKPVWVSPTCYELGHCWTPYCRKASTDVAKNVFTEALKIYGTLYMMAGLLQKKGLSYYLKKFLPETLQSSIFLTVNGTMFISMFCLWRRLMGYYVYYNVFICGIPICIFSILIENKSRQMLGCMYLLTASFIPAYIAAFTAVLFERKSRRGPLAVYLTNLAIETGYRMLVERQLVAPVANGEVYLFSAVSAIYLYLFRKQNGLPRSSESLFRFFVGESENPKRDPQLDKNSRLSKTTAAGGAADPRVGRNTNRTVAVTNPSAQSGSSSSSSSNTVSSTSSTSTSTTTTTTTDSAKTMPLSASHNSAPPPSSSSKSGSLEPPTPQSAATMLAGTADPMIPTSTTAAPNACAAKGSSASASRSALSSLTLVGLTQRLVRRFPVLEEPLRRALEMLSTAVTSLEALPKHPCCPHSHSCLSYVCKGGARMFAIGYGLQAAISSLSVLPALVRRPTALRDTLFSRLNLKLAAFMAGYSAIYRAVNCILRWARGKDAPIHGLVGGALAGLSLRFYRSVTIALYAATKLVEILYFKGIENCGFPYIKSADVFIYAFSTAFIFHAAVMEPHTLRPGYWKFLLRVTGNKFALMNRRLLDIFGVNSSKIAPDYWPDYDPAFTQLARRPS